jgi:hypothetical protein
VRKDLKFRLTVTIDEVGALSSAELRVRDGETRASKSLGGWPVATAGASLDRLLAAIKREIEASAEQQSAIARKAGLAGGRGRKKAD